MNQLQKPIPWKANYLPNPDGTPSIFYLETVLACNLACPECAIGVDKITRNKKLVIFFILQKTLKKNKLSVYFHENLEFHERI